MGLLYLFFNIYSDFKLNPPSCNKVNSDFKDSSNNLKISHQNIRGLRGQLSQLSNILYSELPHIICVTECGCRVELLYGHCMVTRGQECAVVQKSWFGTLLCPFRGGCLNYFLVWKEKILMYCGLCDVVLARG